MPDFRKLFIKKLKWHKFCMFNSRFFKGAGDHPEKFILGYMKVE